VALPICTSRMRRSRMSSRSECRPQANVGCVEFHERSSRKFYASGVARSSNLDNRNVAIRVRGSSTPPRETSSVAFTTAQSEVEQPRSRVESAGSRGWTR
jgi:hypothetical protein